MVADISDSMRSESSAANELDPGAGASDPSRFRGFGWAVAVAILPAVLFFALGIRAVEPINGQDAMTTTVRERVIEDRPRFVVIIDDDSTDVLLGIDEVRALAPYGVVWQRSFESGETTAQIALLERADGSWRDFPCVASTTARPIACP